MDEFKHRQLETERRPRHKGRQTIAYQKTEPHDENLQIVEQYKDYEAGTYGSMTLQEKIDFLDGIHTDNIPLFDECGDEEALERKREVEKMISPLSR